MKIYSITTAHLIAIPRVRFVAYHSAYLLLISINTHRPQQTISRLPQRLANKEDFPVETFLFAIISNYVPMIYANYIFHPPETRAEVEDNKSEGNNIIISDFIR